MWHSWPQKLARRADGGRSQHSLRMIVGPCGVMSSQTKSLLSKESGVLLWKQRGQLGNCLWLASLSWAQLPLRQGANGFPRSTRRVYGQRDAEEGEGGQWGACMSCQHLELHLATDIWEMSDKTGVFAHDFPFLTDFKLLLCAESLQLCPTLCHPVDHGLPGSSVQGFS